ncbi:phytoene/squalene synthase family protein [Corynebacterium tapiri]|uniref:Phytoene/squalene synthase family protein n=1 Tax=Corynebacterium tapiri TaxID=1448266 RepID=A0A5C4U3Y7_9CORY|nr:squalene/phytoene synthase family protein [Corynebacterium tapiri]TNL98433.1 phytoene/squalene synthase family protein [Corynebacterium tapiri]
MAARSPLELFNAASHRAAAGIIGEYSSSFSLATALLHPSIRADIRNLYAMVRIADEIVDGAAAGAGLHPTEIAAVLDDYEQAVLSAPQRHFDPNPVLHAYGRSARRCGFAPEHVRAFFASMRSDVPTADQPSTDLRTYVYGSAEVIGLLCLAVFFADQPRPANFPELEAGARRLGAAFQNINFLRDLGADTQELGREYLSGTQETLDEDAKRQIIAGIRADLGAAYAMIGELPLSSRAGVLAAADLFSELTDKLEATPARQLYLCRVRVSQPRKAVIAARALARARRRSLRGGLS